MKRNAADEKRQRAADEIEVHHDDAEAIGIAREADHVLGADIGDNHGHAGRPPRERSSCEKEIFARPYTAARPEAERGYRDEINDDDRQIDRRELNGFHNRRML